MSLVESRLPVILQAPQTRNQALMPEVQRELEVINKERCLWEKAASIESSGKRVIALAAVVAAYVLTGFALYVIDRNSRATMIEAYLRVYKRHAVSFDLGDRIKQLAKKVGYVSLAVLGLTAVRYFSPVVYNGVGDFCDGIKSSDSKWNYIPAQIIRATQQVGYGCLMAGFQGVTVVGAGKMIAERSLSALVLDAVVVPFQLVKSSVTWVFGSGFAPPSGMIKIDTSVNGQARMGFMGGMLMAALATVKSAKKLLNEEKEYSRELITTVQQRINMRTYMGRALAIDDTIKRFFAVLGVRLMYALTFSGLAVCDSKNAATKEEAIEFLNQQKNNRKIREWMNIGSSLVQLGVAAGTMGALGVSPRSALSLGVFAMMIPQIALLGHLSNLQNSANRQIG